MPLLSASPTVDAVMLESRAAGFGKRSIKNDAKLAAIDLAIRCIDLTTLEGRDSPGRVRSLCAKAACPAPGAPRVAAVCVYPSLVAVAKDALRGTGVKVASVATAFPSGLSSLDVRLRDTEAALSAGADEIDMGIDRGAFLAGGKRAQRPLLLVQRVPTPPEQFAVARQHVPPRLRLRVPQRDQHAIGYRELDRRRGRRALDRPGVRSDEAHRDEQREQRQQRHGGDDRKASS